MGSEKRLLRPSKIEVFENKKAVEEKITIEKPKKSYAWLWWTIGVIVLLIVADFAVRRFLGFNPLAWVMERIFRRKK